MQKITTFLWFDNNLEQAIEFYVSIFPDAKVTAVQRNGDQAFLGRFELAGQEFFALNGGPDHPFTVKIDVAELERAANG
ncbi:MAG: VOC family protein [Rhodoglobus sp.]